MFGIGIQELGIILIVALLVFGPKRLPELARTLGRGLGEFRRASQDLRESLALDDIQQDLRRDLHSAGTIHRPKDEADAPAQAGADLPPGPGSGATPAGAAAPDAAEGETPAPAPHSGELPLGNDHEHHPDPDEELDEEPDAPDEARAEEGASDDAADRSRG